jgi:hypothetical protein
MSSMNKLKLKYFFLLFFIINNYLFSQTCGFGCLGLSGFYGGYTFQKYNAEGLNTYLQKSQVIYNASQVPSINKFEYGTGFRVGANVFRFNYKDFIVTLKGYYQYLKEEKNPFNLSDEKFTLTNNYWGAGFDFGCAISSLVDIKFVDAQVIFNSSELKITSSSANSNANDMDYTNGKNETGYTVGAGFIFKIIDDYLSIEMTGGYSDLKINEIVDDKGNNLLGNNNSFVEGKNFIKSGGIFVSAQLNVGIPLY